MFGRLLLASVAGGASGSVLTWMTMDNAHLKVKQTHAAEIARLQETIMVHEKRLFPLAFGAVATGTIAMLAALASRR